MGLFLTGFLFALVLATLVASTIRLLLRVINGSYSLAERLWRRRQQCRRAHANARRGGLTRSPQLRPRRAPRKERNGHD